MQKCGVCGLVHKYQSYVLRDYLALGPKQQRTTWCIALHMRACLSFLYSLSYTQHSLSYLLDTGCNMAWD